MSKKYLVTGAAGFIASQVSKQLLDRGDRVVGLDNLNDYYEVRLKNWRLEQLKAHPYGAVSYTHLTLPTICSV